MKKLIEQMVKFGLVGIVATLIDVATFYVLNHWTELSYLLVNVISFAVSLIFNYWASMKYVFVSKYSGNERLKEAVIFLLLSIGGLIVQELSLLLFVGSFDMPPIIGKLGATVISLIFNFVSRKLFLEEKM